jgi:hypothetical protein
MKLNPYLSPVTNIVSKWIKDLSVRPKTIKLLEESLGATLQNIDTDKDFSDMIPKALQQNNSQMELDQPKASAQQKK